MLPSPVPTTLPSPVPSPVPTPMPTPSLCHYQLAGTALECGARMRGITRGFRDYVGNKGPDLNFVFNVSVMKQLTVSTCNSSSTVDAAIHMYDRCPEDPFAKLLASADGNTVLPGRHRPCGEFEFDFRVGTSDMVWIVLDLHHANDTGYYELDFYCRDVPTPVRGERSPLCAGRLLCSATTLRRAPPLYCTTTTTTTTAPLRPTTN